MRLTACMPLKSGGSKSPNMKRAILYITVGIVGFLLGIGANSAYELPEPFMSRFETISLAPRPFTYRLAGDFSQAASSVDAPLLATKQSGPLHIMRRQVSAHDYRLCVQDSYCAALSGQNDDDPLLPAVQINWYDATRFAEWLSKKTGNGWRLPTDQEWAFAAGSRFRDDALSVRSTSDPSVRWLAQYRYEADAAATDRLSHPVGFFGENEFGLLDLSGNVWEWTNTCFQRQQLDAEGRPIGRAIVNCGVRVAEGKHRAYITDFLRDPSSGGCAAGATPTNLGFRLVREVPSSLIVDLTNVFTGLSSNALNSPLIKIENIFSPDQHRL
jgi:formylglycine-generating enzyme required for sulfatase activity